MYLDVTYTNGVIAAREKYLLKDKIFRLCELGAEDAFRLLCESGYGSGAEATDVYDYEKLIAAEENALDAFIREYAPSAQEAAYLLSPRDFHNAKAFLKAAYLQEDAEKMLAPQGLIEKETLSACVGNNDFSALEAYPYLQKACKEASALLQEQPSGAKVGEIFEKALYAHLQETVKRKKALKRLLAAKTDMTNILIAFRCGNEKSAVNKYLPGGDLSEKKLATLFLSDFEKIRKAFSGTPYQDFVGLCLESKEKNEPFTAAEKILGGYDTAHFAVRKFDLVKSEPFLYYVYRRRSENANVRIVFVCLLAGLSEQDIKKRIRAM